MTISVTFGALALLLALASQQGILATNERARWQTIPAQAQVISQQAFNVLGTVLPPSQVNGSAIFIPPGYTMETLTQKPFHIYDDEFFEIIGSDPTLTLLAETSGDPLFHEAVVWNPPTDEVFFVQNAGAPAAGTGLNKSAIIQKISLKQVFGLLGQRNISGQVSVDKVDSPLVINPNGGTNYKGRILFTGEGQGNNTPPALFSVDPNPPYNATVVLNNYFGRQFNSLNDVAVNARNKDIYFTDVTYGYFQDFRPAPALPNQVYRLTESTGAVTVVADGFRSPNGITFSPDGSYAYVTDTGPNKGFFGFDYTAPSAIYRFTVQDDGTWEDRKTFAFIDSGVPDGIHCDAQGNVYAGCGDGVQVWNRSGKLLGKIFLGETSANFQFAGTGRMVICAETRLYYITLAASGDPFAA